MPLSNQRVMLTGTVLPTIRSAPTVRETTRNLASSGFLQGGVVLFYKFLRNTYEKMK